MAIRQSIRPADRSTPIMPETAHLSPRLQSRLQLKTGTDLLIFYNTISIPGKYSSQQYNNKFDKKTTLLKTFPHEEKQKEK
ncbi:hypothetical protein BI347_13525 [Chromobacterium sphagni]|uniref:Uncharacterized protein n=1 Tax=Chromobacterium sphagni TaxID=1903179 RepID=A0A1S1X4J8_9NEIS|nr:hypothetical protein [Chromobacterium sphagni]OHX14411.1 hypothetical protein BI347_13525 [Chromobacterium sphagni]